MEGSVSSSVTEAAHNLTDAALKFSEEAQQTLDAGVDLGQEAVGTAAHTAISAVETVLSGLKALVAKA